MSVPTVSSITPNGGLSGGHVLIQIAGTNFQLPPVPPPTGRPTTAKPNPTVRVTFVGSKMSRVAPKVYVVATTLLYVEVPAMDPEFTDATEATAAPTAVRVENVDQDGAVVGSETVTFSSGYTFRRPDLAALASPANDGSNLIRVVRALVQDLKRQVLKNVYITVSVDYDSTTADNLNIVEKAALPSIILVGPTFRENRLFSLNAPRAEDLGGGFFSKLRTPKTMDLEFDILVASDGTMELFVLMELCTQYFQRNIFLRVQREKGNPAAGEVEYEMDMLRGGEVATADRANEANLRQFSGRLVIRGVDLDEADMVIGRTKTLADFVQVGADSQAVTPSAVILGTDVAGVVTVGQGGSDPTGGANDTPPPLDFEQYQGD